VSSGTHKLDELRSRVAALRSPGIAQAQSCLKESRKLHAAAAFAHALSVLRWSQRQCATYIGKDESVIRSWIDAHQQPAWIPLALPRDGYLAFLEALLGDVPPESKTGTDGY
jgi:hypothetical protein